MSYGLMSLWRLSITDVDCNSARRDFLNYALSLMRSHNDEHSDTLPILDISALKHVAYVFDALIYYMRSGTDSDADLLKDGISVQSWQDHDENENEEQEDDPVSQNVTMETDSMDGDSDVGGKTGRKHPFFQRSDSTTFLGCPPPDPFKTALVEALPLADQPHLLQPNARREDLFGIPKQTLSPDSEGSGGSVPPTPFDKLPTHLALSTRTVENPFSQAVPLLPFPPPPPVEVPSCSVPGPSTSGSSSTPLVLPGPSQLLPSSEPGPSGTSVIVKPSSQPAEPLDACLPAVPHTDTASPASPPSSRPFTQPSVIVHAGSAQPLPLSSGGAKEEAPTVLPSTSGKQEPGESKAAKGDSPAEPSRPSASVPHTTGWVLMFWTILMASAIYIASTAPYSWYSICTEV